MSGGGVFWGVQVSPGWAIWAGLSFAYRGVLKEVAVERSCDAGPAGVDSPSLGGALRGRLTVVINW